MIKTNNEEQRLSKIRILILGIAKTKYIRQDVTTCSWELPAPNPKKKDKDANTILAETFKRCSRLAPMDISIQEIIDRPSIAGTR
jgi:hypothetical protein